MKLLMYLPVLGKLYPVFHASLDEGICGEFSGDKIIINSSICSKKMPELFKETLLHEMGHALCCRCGLRQMPGFTLDIEEIVVEMFAKLFHEAFTFYLKKQYKDFGDPEISQSET